MVKKMTSPIFFLFMLSVVFVGSPLGAQEHKAIVETLQVENVEIPVRVLAEKQLVGGLNKEAFQLWVNGKPKEINGFYEVRKKLGEMLPSEQGPTPGSKPAVQPRLFVLIFNLSSFQQDLNPVLDALFKQVVRPADYLMVISNRYFISEWKVVDEEQARSKIKETLDKEIHRIKLDMLGFEAELKYLAGTLKYQLANLDEGQTPDRCYREFFSQYQVILRNIKENFLDIPVEQYIKIAGYLKSQRRDAWVLNFYQLGFLPMLDNFGVINQYLMNFIDGEYAVAMKHTLQSHYFDFISQVKTIDNQFIADIGKTFLNSGATVHTQLLHPVSRNLSGDYKYETLTTQSESILKNLSRLTGGTVLSSNSTGKFVTDIKAKEDIVYFLTYVPEKSEKRKEQKIEIKMNNPGYRLVYDDQRRLKTFEKKMARLNRDRKDIEIESFTCNDNLVTIRLKNLQVVRNEGEEFSTVQVHLKILDNRSRLSSAIEKLFKGKKSEGTVQVKLPALPGGDYNIVLEVKDLFSLKRIVAGDAIRITKSKTL